MNLIPLIIAVQKCTKFTTGDCLMEIALARDIAITYVKFKFKKYNCTI